MSFVTYAHTKKDGKIFYIGKGIEKRAYSHQSRNWSWKKMVAKEGLNVQILAYWQDEKEAFSHEVLLIECLKELGHPLVNITNGGDGASGYKWTPEQLKRLSEAHKGINKGLFAGTKNPSYGHTKELNKKYKGPILATNVKTGEQLVLEGANDIQSKGFNRGHVSRCVLGSRKTHKGFTFKRVENGKEVKDSSLRNKP